jgi:hypothetical protein
MRVRGRRLYPSTLAERRLMMSLGGTPLYAPRGVSPYVIARRIGRSARGESADLQLLREAFARQCRKQVSEREPAVLLTHARATEAFGDENTVAA